MAIPVESFFLPQGAAGTLQQRIRQMVSEGILSGRFRAGDRMPSSRGLAEHLGVSRITVTLAYTELVSSDYLTARGRSGYYVSEGVPVQPAFRPVPKREEKVDWEAVTGRRFSGQPRLERPEDWRAYPYPFIYGQADASLFDHQNWRLCAVQALGRRDFETLTGDYYEQDDPMLIEYILRNIQATQAAMREVVGRSTMDFILTDGRQAVADQIKVSLQERLNDYKAGMIVTEVNLQQAQPPDQVLDAFADAIKAREDKERLQSEAEAYANDRLPRARGEAARRIAEATAYRDQTVARAQGDAARFSALYEEYKKAPQITRKRMYYDAMSDVYAGSSKVLIDIDKGNPAFYLPLEQLLKNAQKNAEPPSEFVSGSLPRSSPTRNSADDAARSRDRSR